MLADRRCAVGRGHWWLLLALACGCDRASDEVLVAAAATRGEGRTEIDGPRKTGVLLVSHGSRSAEWREMLGDFHRAVEPRLLELPEISGVKSAFMEYSEPSIATSLRQFDDDNVDHVILIPLLLTVSTHSFDDIPTIIGAKDDARSALTLKSENVERYRPRARVSIAPLLDFSTLLRLNLPRRIRLLSQDSAREGVVIVAYGSEEYNEEWENCFGGLDQAVRDATGVAEVRHCWCGHVVRYSKQPLQEAVRALLSRNERVLVVPALVARDRFFQDQIIGEALEEIAAGPRVAYAGDAILPDPQLDEWVVAITAQTLQQQQAAGTGSSP